MKHRVDRVADHADALLGHAEQLDGLALRELGDREDARRRARDRADREAPARPVPAREELGMADEREVVDRDRERHRGAERPAEGGAVEDVEAAGGERQAGEVPGGIARDGGEPARPAEREPLHVDLVAPRQRAEQAVHVPRRSGARLAQRRDVDTHLHAAASS